MLRPKEIQARIRAGASVEQLADVRRGRHRPGRAVRPSGAAGALPGRRAGNRRPSRARRRPVGADAAGDRHHGAGGAWPGPRRHARGTRGATRTAAGPCRWAGRPAAPTTSRTSGSRPGAHGGTVTAVDDAASELIDPELRPPAAAAGGAGRPARLRRAPTTAIAGRRSAGTRARAGTGGAAETRPEPAALRAAPRPPRQALGRGAGVGGRAARGALQRRSADDASAPAAIASSASHAPATPTPAPSTNQRSTGVCRHPHTVGARPPTATRLSPTASSGCTRIRPRLSTTTAARGDRGDERRDRQTRCPRAWIRRSSSASLARS